MITIMIQFSTNEVKWLGCIITDSSSEIVIYLDFICPNIEPIKINKILNELKFEK